MVVRVLSVAVLVSTIVLQSAGQGIAQDGVAALKSELLFHASFDGTADAQVFKTDGRAYTAESLARKELKPGMTRPNVTIAAGKGKYGDCLRFTGKSKEVLCYSGSEMPYSDSSWSCTVSFWMRLNPDQDLLPGYCDPIQITQFAWNNGALFVDFDKDLPRDFRLGVFSDLKFWNPENIPWEKLPVEKRPMVTVKKPPFDRDRWTHVLFTLDNVNSAGAADKPSKAAFYLNGQFQGELKQPMQIRWDREKTAIMLGIEYIGDLDDLTIFKRALTAAEVKLLSELKQPL